MNLRSMGPVGMCTLKRTTLFHQWVHPANRGTWRLRQVWRCTCSSRYFPWHLRISSASSVRHSKHLCRATDGKGALLRLCLLNRHLLLIWSLGDAGQVQSQDFVWVYTTHDMGILFDNLWGDPVTINGSIFLCNFFFITLLAQFDAWLAFPYPQA